MYKAVMRLIKPAVSVVFLLVFMTSCATSGKQKSDTTDSIHSVVPLAITLPALPLAMAYHALNDTEEKQRKQLELLQKEINPVYEERIRILTARDPKLDARVQYQNGVAAYFPSCTTCHMFPGLESSTGSTIDFDRNSSFISNSKELAYIVEITSMAPAHEKNIVLYQSSIYNEFIKVRYDYLSKFNTEMWLLNSKAK